MARQNRTDKDGIYERPDSPYYWASFTDANGQRIRCTTGIRKSAKGRQEAESLLGKWKVEAHHQRQWGKEPSRTFEEVMLAYMQSVAGRRSFNSLRYFAKQIRMSLAGRAMEQLRAIDIAAHVERRRGDGITDSSINRELELLSAAINYTNRQFEWNLPNPVSGRMLKEPQGRVRWISREESARLLTAAGESRSPYLQDLLTVALNTGMRREEMLGLEWVRVDLHNNLLHLDSKHTKSAKRRSVPINQTARAAILTRARFRAENCPESPWVFCKQNGRRIKDARKGFYAACGKAGITDFRFHDLRHTCAAWLVTAGVPLPEVRDLLGHASITMTERYAHLSPHRVRSAVAVLDDASRFGHGEQQTDPLQAFK